MPTVIGVIGGGCGSYWIQSKDLKEEVIRKNGGVRVHCVSSSSTATASAVDGPYKTLRIHPNAFVSEIKTGLRRLAFQVQLKDSKKVMRKIYGVRVRCLSSNSAVDDPYHTLRIQPGASESEVKKAFRQLALQYHPDVCRGSNCGVQFHLINEAYDILMSKLRKQVRRKLRAESKADKSKKTDKSKSDKSFIPWTPPLAGAYKVNFDASFQKGKTALAALARDDYGEVVWAKALCGLAANSLAAEAEAAKMTAIWATEEKWNSVILEGDDTLEIVKAVTDTSMQLPCYIKSLAQDIRLLIRPYPRWSMASIPSSANTAAREMASWALRMNFSGSLSKHDLPISVMKALRKDSCRLPLDSSMP